MLGLFGRQLQSTVPWSELLVGGVATAALGLLLAAVASVYPSLKAARLAPMEAMRIE
jgi:ABC-type lipoprotein release transport system permease subunit